MAERSKQNYNDYYETINVIRICRYGYVYKGIDKETKELRAIKIMDKEKIRKNLSYQYEIKEIENQLKIYIEGFIQEFENMKICSKNNDNSVKCYEYFNNKDNFVIIMELCDENLLRILKKRIENDKKGFNSEEISEIMEELNNTFKIMKENNIIHRNLKLENILIKYHDKEHKKYTLKLSDYICSKRLISLSQNCIDIYMAPEILSGGEYNYKCDLWSIGIIIYRLIFGNMPYKGETENEILNNINNLGNKILKEAENKDLIDLIKKLLEKDPLKRINWDEYYNHCFFKNKYKKVINLIYYLEQDGKCHIFGEKFVENNKNKIELVINGKKNELVNDYELKKGENNIQLIIKHKINNLEGMFKYCNKLKNIEELKYLDTEDIKNFSEMFWGCSSLLDINGLENWNVSNGNIFADMFCYCKSLSNINELRNWNVSNGNNFSCMFYKCSSLLDINGLKNWNVSKGNNFSSMFSGCSSLLDINGLKNWNVSHVNNFTYIFNQCLSLKDINGLINWDVSNQNNLSYMFNECSSLSDLNGLINWNVSNVNNFSYMFNQCTSLSDFFIYVQSMHIIIRPKWINKLECFKCK